MKLLYYIMPKSTTLTFSHMIDRIIAFDLSLAHKNQHAYSYENVNIDDSICIFFRIFNQRNYWIHKLNRIT